MSAAGDAVVSTPSGLAGRVLAGDPRAIARAISIVEDDEEAGAALLQTLNPQAGRAYLVGITGPPGAGKSTVVDRLVTLVRSEGLTAGVLAVDPTSPFTGGALLGDRVRMVGHAGDTGVFVRSMATRGQLGGVARATSDAATILDASGTDIVIIETVGVGQDEVDVVRTADISIVVLVPGAGDDVQAIKAGLMEIADMFVVNKADMDGADRLVQVLAANQALRAPGPHEWQPPILRTIATSGEGIPQVWSAVQRFREWSRASAVDRRRQRHEWRLRRELHEAAARYVDGALEAGVFDRAVDRLAAQQVGPRAAAAELLAKVGVR